MSSEVSERQKIKELKSILRSTRSIRFRLILTGEYDRFKSDILVFEESLVTKIDEIEFYIELEKQLSGEE